MIRFAVLLSSVLCLLASGASAATNAPAGATYRQLAAIHRDAAESGKKVKMQPHREKAERFMATAKGEPVSVTMFTDGTSRTNRIHTVIKTARLGAPLAAPQPPPGKHSKEYLLGFAAGLAAAAAAYGFKRTFT
jgi:hypothetical protein